MQDALLHVITACAATPQEAQDVIRLLRRSAGPSDMRTFLLLCDLPDADALHMPQDEAILKTLQSGVMSLNTRSETRFFLLVRRRAWDDASRRYLGCHQAKSHLQLLADLLLSGETTARFDAATCSPASFRACCSAVLLSSLSLTCTPDTPVHMLQQLQEAAAPMLGAQVLPRCAFPRSALARLVQRPLSLSSFHALRLHAYARYALSPPDAPTLYTLSGLQAASISPDAPAALAKDCFFVRRAPLTLRDLLCAHRQLCLRHPLHALLPPLQLLLLFLGALWGLPLLAGVAALLPELGSLIYPALLPGVLLRLLLLPLTALRALDALFSLLLARSRLIRIHVPDSLLSGGGCALFGAALLGAAFSGSGTLPVLLPLCLLWLAAPLLLPALDAPTLERIPLDTQQLATLHTQAKHAYPNASSSLGAKGMLVACSACMLGLLEPDEAGRRTLALLEACTPASAFDRVAMLSAAQYLREHMADCDAALRDLPAQIEHAVRSAPPHEKNTQLGLFLSCALSGDVQGYRATRFIPSAPLDMLFLPLGAARHTPRHPLTLPLSHPHTYLRQSEEANPDPSASAEDLFLVLCAAALGHPFYPLLMRSPICAPYAALMDI